MATARKPGRFSIKSLAKRLEERDRFSRITPELAKVKASQIFSRRMRRFDKSHPEIRQKLLSKGSYLELYIRQLGKYHPMLSREQLNYLAATIEEARNAAITLENPSLGKQKKDHLRTRIVRLKLRLQESEISKTEQSRIIKGIALTEQQLFNKGLSGGQKAFLRFIANNPGALFAKNKLTESGLRLSSYLAHKIYYSHRGTCYLAGMTLDDCVQEASVGLMDAARRIKPGISFVNYASQCARGAVFSALRENASIANIPRTTLKKIINEEAFAKAKADLYEKSQSAPSELVRKRAAQRILELQNARALLNPVSGNEKVSRNKNPSGDKTVELFETIIDLANNPAASVEAVDLREHLIKAFSFRKGTGSFAWKLLLEGQNQKEIARTTGFSESMISQQLQRSLSELLAIRPNVFRELGFEVPERNAPLSEKERKLIAKKAIFSLRKKS